MRKLLFIFLIAAFFTSIFDVIDVGDIRLGDSAIFSTTDTDADNAQDDISDHEYTFAENVFFILPSIGRDWVDLSIDMPMPCDFSGEVFAYDFSPRNLFRPPIV